MSSDGPSFVGVIRAYAASDARVLLRTRTPVVFLFLLPALLSLMLGPAVSGDTTGGSQGRTLLGFAVVFSFMTINYAGISFFREFWGNTWVRQAVHRPSRIAFIVGKTLPAAVAGFLQLSVFSALAFGVFGLPLHGNPVQLLLVGVVLVWCGSTIGVALYIVSGSPATFQGITFLLLLALGSIGGAIVVPDRLPQFVQRLSPLTPHYWALRAVQESTVGAGSWWPTWQAVGIIGGVTLVLTTICLITFDYTREKSVMT